MTGPTVLATPSGTAETLYELPSVDEQLGLSNVRIRRFKHGTIAYLRTDGYIGQSLERYGEYAEQELQLLKTFVPTGGLVIDAGANIGIHTIFFSRCVGPQGVVLAFEPQRIIHQVLCANITLNELGNVHVMQKGVGAQQSVGVLPWIDYGVLNNFGGVSLEQTSDGEPVLIEPLDAYRFGRCDVIKIDVEGMELEVLAGARETIRAFRPVLYLEADRPETYVALMNELFALEYRVYSHNARLVNRSHDDNGEEISFYTLISCNVLALPREIPQSINLSEIKNADDGLTELLLWNSGPEKRKFMEVPENSARLPQ